MDQPKTMDLAAPRSCPSISKPPECLTPRTRSPNWLAASIHIRGSRFDQRPVGLEAKVVADADLLAKFGTLGVYQAIRTHTEFAWPLTKIIDFMSARRDSPLVLETETGRRLAEPGRQLVVDFYRTLQQEA